MDLNNLGFHPAWLAAGGIFALLAGFWNHVRAMISQVSKLMVVSATLDAPTTMDVVRYIRAHYKWYQFSDVNFRSIYKTHIKTGTSIWVPFTTPTESGFYKGPHGVIWVESHSPMLRIKAIRWTVNFQQLVHDANEWDQKLRSQESPDRFYVRKVIGSEKGSWAMGEAIRALDRSQDSATEPSSVGSGSTTSRKYQDNDCPCTVQVYEDIDRSFKYRKEEYTRMGKDDPFKGLFFTEPALKEVQDARNWMSMSTWYADRSIPWRRGTLIYGPPGTGKSSFAKALGETLGIPIYQFFLNTLSDQEFIKEWSAMPSPCIALLEDFDNVFHGREPQTEHKALTFDCVLNQISGVASSNGVYLLVTTNDISKIDPAMGVIAENCDGQSSGLSTRPGRIDRVIYMGAAPIDQRIAIARHILKDWPEEVQALVTKTDGMSPAQVQETCTQIAYDKLSKRVPKAITPKLGLPSDFGRATISADVQDVQSS